MGGKHEEPGAPRRRWARRVLHDGDDVIVDLSSRLDDLCGDPHRCVTGEQIRQAFAPKPTPEKPPCRDRGFTDHFPTETLFVHTKVDSDHDPVSENRSRSAGDYYYDPVDAWAEFGLPEDAPWADVVTAHRALAMIHHPDRHLDGSEYEQQSAQDAMTRVNVAYSVLRRMTGN